MSTFHHPAGPACSSWLRSRRGKACRQRSPGRFFLLTAVLLPLMAGWRLVACSTPVCQYALENWPPDAYEILVSASAPVAATLRASCEEAMAGAGTAGLNAALRFIEDASLPASEVHVTVRMPDHPAARLPVWTGPLSPERLRWIVDSPVRARLAEELLRGAAAVFLFLPSGDAAIDTAARARLQTTLEEMSSNLMRPAPDADDTATAEAGPSVPFRFAVLDVSRQDPAEGFLQAMLLASEPDLAGLHEPMTFPVFGRGRALYAIVGAGINRDVLAEACVFLTGACSCQVKAQNPGVDLLLRADWDRVAGQTPAFTELPPLAGLSAPAPDSPPPAVAAVAPAAVVPPTPSSPSPAASPRLARRVLIVAAAAVAASLAGTLILLAATRSR